MYYIYNDISIFYEKYGNKKKNILILPGWGDTRKTFKYLIAFLKEYFTVYIIDYPGFGESPMPNKTLTIFDYSDLIYNFINEKELDDPILIGHSFGGRIITTLTGYFQYSFSNIIYIDSAGIKPKRKIKNIIYKLYKSIGKLLPKKLRKKYYKYIFNKFASNDYKNLDNNMKQTFKNIINYDLKNYLKNIKSKVLIIWGEKDTSTPLKDGIYMNKKINNSELIILKNNNHFPYLNNPYLFNSIIYEQLKEEII